MDDAFTFNEYVQAVADAIENCGELLPARQAVIRAAAHDLEVNEWAGQEARSFWQMVAAILLWRRPVYDLARASALAEAAEEVLEQAAIYGAIL